MSTPRQPPHSTEAEANVLGGLMLDSRPFFDLADKLSAEDFYRADHQEIYRGIVALISANKPSDFVSLTEHFRNLGRLEEAGGLSYLGTLANDTYSVTSIRHYADIVRERAVLRRLIAAGSDIALSGYAPEGRDSNELLTVAATAIQSIQDRRHSVDARTYADLMQSVSAQLEHIAEHGPQRGITTGLVDFDNLTTGFHPGDFVVVAARPSMGKTTFAMQLAEATAMANKRVQVFSMEMPAEMLGQRSVSHLSRVPINAMRDGKLDADQWRRVREAQGALRGLPLLVDDSSALSPMELRARAMRAHRKSPLSMIVVDYLQLMSIRGAENRTNEISEISRSLKALAKDLQIPVVALSQLNRGLENRDVKRPRMADLRESGGIEQDADLIVFLYRDEIYHADSREKGTAEIIVAKQRNGPLDTVRTAYFPEYFSFQNLAHGWRPLEAPAQTKRRGFAAPPRPYSEPVGVDL